MLFIHILNLALVLSLIAKQLDIPLVHTYHTMYEDYVHYITRLFDGASKKSGIFNQILL